MYSIRHSEACPLSADRLLGPIGDALWFAVLPALHAGSYIPSFCPPETLERRLTTLQSRASRQLQGFPLHSPSTFLCESVSLPVFLFTAFSLLPYHQQIRHHFKPQELFIPPSPPALSFPGTVEGSGIDLSLCLIPEGFHFPLLIKKQDLAAPAFHLPAIAPRPFLSQLPLPPSSCSLQGLPKEESFLCCHPGHKAHQFPLFPSIASWSTVPTTLFLTH